MKHLSFLLVVPTLAALLFSGCIRLNTNDFKITYSYDNADRYKPGSEPIANEISKLEVDWVSGNVAIESYDGSELTFAESSDKTLDEKTTMHYWMQEGGHLHIQFGKSGSKFKNLDKQLTVKIPASWNLDKIELDVVSSDVTVNGIVCDDFELDGVSADVDIRTSAMKEFEMNTVSGNLNADFSGADAEACLNKFSLESVSGSASLVLPENWGFSAEMESVSGKVICPFATKVAKGEYTYGDGRIDIDMESVSGSLTISH